MKIVLATANSGKIEEIRAIFDDPRLILISMADFPARPELAETGNSFKENAVQKAAAVADYYLLPALADDSGLEVDALGGEPGIFSARYSGPEADAVANNAKLLKELAGVPDDERTARFRSVAACFIPPDRIIATEGSLEGRITFEPAGGGGFGYDPLFIPLGMNSTCAQLSPAEKNAISHRGQAFLKMKTLLLRKENELSGA